MPRLLSIASVLLVAFAAPAFAGPFGSGGSGTPPALAKKLNQPVPSSLIETLKKGSKAGLGLGVIPRQLGLKLVNGPRLETAGDKVGLLYVGADFCPYCAGQRWALILTLVRFGKFDGLEYMASSPKDAFPNTPTFSFQNATYSSDHVALKAVETADRNGKPLMKQTEAQQKIVTKFDAPPYAPYFGGIPFIYLDGQYILAQPMLRPADLAGQSWEAIANTLADPQSPLFQKVMPRVNALTAAICRLDGGNPGEVCSAPGVIAANGALLRLSTSGP